MEDGRIPTYILYGELASGKRSVGRPQLRYYYYNDVCKRDLNTLDIDTNSWEDTSADRSRWRSTLQRQLKAGEVRILTLADEKHEPSEKHEHAEKPCDHSHLYQMRQRLPFTNWTCKPQPTLWQPWQNYHQNLTSRAHYPWSTLTDGGLLATMYIDSYFALTLSMHDK